MMYSSAMKTSTITIRLPQSQRDNLKARATRLHKTESDFIRELLAREFDQAAFGERASEFVGCLDSGPTAPAPVDALRTAIKRHNWRAK